MAGTATNERIVTQAIMVACTMMLRTGTPWRLTLARRGLRRRSRDTAMSTRAYMSMKAMVMAIWLKASTMSTILPPSGPKTMFMTWTLAVILPAWLAGIMTMIPKVPAI